MRRTELDAVLKNVDSWCEFGNQEARQGFVDAMRRRHCSDAQVLDAWRWFVLGWRHGFDTGFNNWHGDD